MESFEILVNCNDVSDQNRKLLLELCDKNNIKVNNIKRKTKGFTLLLHDQTEADKLFLDDSKSELSGYGFQPILSNKLKSFRTFLAKKIDRSILENQPDEIKNEITARNSSRLVVTEIFKIPNSSILKVTLKSSAMVDIVMKEGFMMFNMHISPHVINREDYIELINCFNCFEINDHLKSECRKPPQTICSKCGSNHFYRDCSATPDQYSCINCRGNHLTLSSSCPKRKAIVKSIRSSKRSGKSYANVLKRPQNSAIRTSNFSNDQLNIPNSGFNLGHWNKTASIVQLALIGNLIRPGTFSSTYNDLCNENDLPTLNLTSFNPPTKEELQNAGFDASKIINNLLEHPNEFSPEDVALSSTLRDINSNSHYQSLPNENEALPVNTPASSTQPSPNSPVSNNQTSDSTAAQLLAAPAGPQASNNENNASDRDQNKSIQPETNCDIKGFKIRYTATNPPNNLRKALESKRLFFTKNNKIINDQAVLNDIITSEPLPEITTMEKPQFSRLLEDLTD